MDGTYKGGDGRSELFATDPDIEFGRLRGLEAAYDPATFELLDAAGLAPGWRCLEVGAGAGSVALALQARGCIVWAVDKEVSHIAALSSPTLRVVEADIESISSAELPGGLDLVHSRLLLDLLRDPAAVIGRLLSRLAPGGWLALEEFDDLTIADAIGSGPMIELHRRVVEAKVTAWDDRGQDNYLGRRLVELLGRAGVGNLQSWCTCKVRRSGTPEALPWTQFLRGARAGLMDAGLSAADYEDYMNALSQPGFSYLSPLMVRVLGQRAG